MVKRYREKPMVLHVIEVDQLKRGYVEQTIEWIKSKGGEVLSHNLGEFPEDGCYVEVRGYIGYPLFVYEDEYIVYTEADGVFDKIYQEILNEYFDEITE